MDYSRGKFILAGTAVAFLFISTTALAATTTPKTLTTNASSTPNQGGALMSSTSTTSNNSTTTPNISTDASTTTDSEAPSLTTLATPSKEVAPILLSCTSAYTADLFDTPSGHNDRTRAKKIGTQSWTNCVDGQGNLYEFKITPQQYAALAQADASMPTEYATSSAEIVPAIPEDTQPSPPPPPADASLTPPTDSEPVNTSTSTPQDNGGDASSTPPSDATTTPPVDNPPPSTSPTSGSTTDATIPPEESTSTNS